MKTVAEPAVRRALIGRLRALRPETAGRWGTLTPHEMLCHLCDAADMVLRTRPRVVRITVRRRLLLKWLTLWSPFRWLHGWPTNPEHDPRAKGTRPTEFERDRERLIASMTALGDASDSVLEPAHGFFGVMSTRDWQRWMYKHADHHLRQFGV